MRYLHTSEGGRGRYAQRARRRGRRRPARTTLEHVLDLEVEVEAQIEVGETGNGLRRIIPIVGGTVSGRVEGRVLPGGADYQLFRVDRPT